MTKSRITITLSTEADKMLDGLAARDMRSRGAVVELLIRAAHSGTPVPQESRLSAATAPQQSHSAHTTVYADAAPSAAEVAQEPRGDFHAAMLNLDEMCS